MGDVAAGCQGACNSHPCGQGGAERGTPLMRTLPPGPSRWVPLGGPTLTVFLWCKGMLVQKAASQSLAQGPPSPPRPPPRPTTSLGCLRVPSWGRRVGRPGVGWCWHPLAPHSRSEPPRKPSCALPPRSQRGQPPSTLAIKLTSIAVVLATGRRLGVGGALGDCGGGPPRTRQ